MSVVRYFGLVLDQDRGAGVAGVRVEAWDTGGVLSDAVAIAVTGADGQFRMSLARDEVDALFAGRSATVAFRVVSGTSVLARTDCTHQWNLRGDGRGRIDVDPGISIASISAPPRLVVRGRLLDAITGPVSGVTVHAFDRNVTEAGITETSLGTDTTDARGRYRISFANLALGRAGKEVADLTVRAIDGTTVVAEQRVCGALPITEVDLIRSGTWYAGASEHARLLSSLEPHRGTAAWRSLTTEQAGLVACSGQAPRKAVDALVAAAQMAHEVAAVSEEVFFGLIRHGLPSNRVLLLSHRPTHLRRTLEKAIAAGTVSGALTSSLDAIELALEDAAVAASFEARPTGVGLGTLVSHTPSLSATLQQSFVRKVLKHEGDSAAFWASLDADTDFAGHVPGLRFTVEVTPLVANHPAMLDHLHALRTAETLQIPSDLGKLRLQDWQLYIESTGVPSGVLGDTEALRKSTYALWITETAKARFRTAAVASAIKLAEPSSPTTIFFDDNKDFLFEKQRIAHYLKSNLQALTNIPAGSHNAVVTRLKTLERLFPLTRSYEQMAALETAGLHSAYAICRKGKASFLLDHAAALGGDAKATEVFAAADWVVSASSALLGKHSSKLHVGIGALPDTKTLPATPPDAACDWADLFGSADACACDHCQSVLSPSAYLVDVLQFLGRQPGTSGTGRDLLLAKRPDIAHLELSCNASETPLPYVDLVLEILEIALATGQTPPLPWPADTGKNLSDAQDLLAAPDVLYPAVHNHAYSVLANAAYPFEIPFHLWAEEARLYLGHLGVPRGELIRALAANPEDTQVRSWVTAERLGVSLRKLAIIGGTQAGVVLSELWGYPANEADFNTHFVSVPTFLRAAGLTFGELRELIATDLYPSLALPSDVKCDVSKMEWTAPTLEDLTKIHSFLRLRKALGWSITDMGRAVSALGSISALAVERMASLDGLRHALDIDVPAALSLFADIDRNNAWEPSLFERLFLRRDVTNGDDAAFAEVFAAEGGTPVPTRSLADNKSRILAAIGGSESDLALVIDPAAAGAQLALRRSIHEDGAADLTLQNLSRVHRIFMLARAADLSIRDYLTLHALHGQDVIKGDLNNIAEPRSLEAFLDVVQRVRESKFPIAELHYIARHVAGKKDTFAPSATQVDQLLSLLASGVKTAAASMKAGPSTTERAKALLRQLIPVPADVTSLLEIVDGTSADPLATQHEKIEAILSPLLEDVLDAKHRLVGLTDGDTERLPTSGERYAYLLRRLLKVEEAFVKQALSEAFGLAPLIVERLVSTSVLVSMTLPGRSALRDFVAGSDPTVPAGPEIWRRTHLLRIHKAALLTSRLRIQPAEFLLLFPETGQEPSWGLPWINFGTLPVEPPLAPANPIPPGEPAQAYLEGGILAFARLLRFIDFAALRDRWAAGGEQLLSLLEQAAAEPPPVNPEDLPSPQLQETLSEQLELPPADITAVVTRFALGAADLCKVDTLLRLDTVRTVLRRLAVSATDAIAWTQLDAPLPVPGTEGALAIARDIERAARNKYSADAWAAVARPLRDDLRERQRKALVAFLMAQRGQGDAGALYDDLLIDVEMSPCMLTSRTVQAIAAAQLFVQRSLLHLTRSAQNTPFTLTEEAAREWEWLKTYRVWEANRKVFLYPENWLEPELRDDKTPLFRAFESRLAQGPLTHESAEKALRTYLEELHEIGHLQIVAMATQEDDEAPSGALGPFAPKRVVHLFGRTNSPNVHYYRSFEDGRFTPWEKIDLDLPDSYLVPVVHGGRLFLFWPVIQERKASSGGGAVLMNGQKTEPAGADPNVPTETSRGDNEADPLPIIEYAPPKPEEKAPSKRVSVQFAYSERTGGKFTKKRHPRDLAVEIPIDIPTDAPAVAPYLKPLFFLGHSDGESIWIDCCAVGHSDSPGDPGDAYTRFAKFQFHPCNQWPKTWVGSTLRDLAVPPGTEPDKQLFTGDETLSLVTEVDEAVTFTEVLFDDMTRDFQLVADRSAEPAQVRPYVVFSDTERTFFLERRIREVKELLHASKFLKIPGLGGAAVNVRPGTAEYTFEDAWFRAVPLYHPRACAFLTIAARGGIDGLLRWASQTAPVQLGFTDIHADYHPNTEAVESPFPVEEVDFSPGGAYSTYNWEVFFHAPLLVAARLDVEQRFAEADRWYRYIFDPTDGSSADAPARFWKVRPFYENQSASDLLTDLTAASVNAYVQETAALANKDHASKASDDFASQVTVWRRDPFNPYAIARTRPIAFQKAVVLRYIDHLLKWGDKMFRMDTRESVAEATQLYMLASNLLGPRPTIVGKVNPPEPKTYDVLQSQAIDAFSNALVDVETLAPPPPAWKPGFGDGQSPPESVWGTLYFCLPPNEKLLGLWDVVADRLFKIRHCMNIDGTRRELSLFEPPIDPALLVRAKAAGLSFDDVLGDLYAGPPIYRFGVLHARAVEMTGYVSSLGAGLLSAMEKRDGEHLATLRTTHEIQLAQAVREVKKRQIDEAKVQVTALERSRAVVEERRRFYAEIPKRIEAENQQFTNIDMATGFQVAAQAASAAAAGVVAVPNVQTGTLAGPSGGGLAMIEGPSGAQGWRLANIAQAGLLALSHGYAQEATKQGIEAGYQRREAEWNLQKTLAERELAQIDKQLVAAQIRVALAEKDIDVHEQSVEQMREVRDFFRDKFTNEELYDWLVAQSFEVYSQAYQLAYQMAKRAERAYQYERGDKNDVFVRFGGWDSSRQGLLAGERLSLDLRRMEAAYLENNRREYELTKHVSLASHDPEALLKLRELGEANLKITEADYDRDHPTHYMRRLKNVAVTVPCVTGPYQGVNGKLTLLNGEIRTSPTGSVMEASRGAIQSIVTSSGQNDAGVFELAFRDDRLLPFEGVGAQAAANAGANFQFELSRDHNRFDFDSIADLVLTVRYTARDGRLAAASPSYVGARLFSAKQDFADAWQAFAESDAEHLVLAFTARQFARPHSKPTIKMDRLRFYTKRVGEGSVADNWASIVSPGGPSLQGGEALGSRLKCRETTSTQLALSPVTWTLSVSATPHADLADIWIIVDYTAT